MALLSALASHSTLFAKTFVLIVLKLQFFEHGVCPWGKTLAAERAKPALPAFKSSLLLPTNILWIMGLLLHLSYLSTPHGSKD